MMKKSIIFIGLAVCLSSFLAVGADRLAECQSKITAAQEAGIIHRMYVEPDGLHVVVDSASWSQSPYTTKLGMAVTAECSIVEPGERLVAVIFHDHRTNKVVGRYQYPDLKVE